jgi:hypothetical protein
MVVRRDFFFQYILQRMHVTIVTAAAFSGESSIFSSKILNLLATIPGAYFANHLAVDVWWLQIYHSVVRDIMGMVSLDYPRISLTLYRCKSKMITFTNYFS